MLSVEIQRGEKLF